MNSSIPLPDGTTNHGNPNLLCVPTHWFDVFLFFSTNYFAHAASVVTLPGQSTRSTRNQTLLALGFPGAGVARAVSAIIQHAATERNDPFKRAARAGAICVLQRRFAFKGPVPTVPDSVLDLEQGQKECREPYRAGTEMGLQHARLDGQLPDEEIVPAAGDGEHNAPRVHTESTKLGSNGEM